MYIAVDDGQVQLSFPARRHRGRETLIVDDGRGDADAANEPELHVRCPFAFAVSASYRSAPVWDRGPELTRWAF